VVQERARKKAEPTGAPPFLIACNSGGQTRVPGTGNYVAGVTTAAYLVPYFPTTVLIGRDGNVVKQVSLLGEDGYREVEKTLEPLLPR